MSTEFDNIKRGLLGVVKHTEGRAPANVPTLRRRRVFVSHAVAV